MVTAGGPPWASRAVAAASRMVATSALDAPSAAGQNYWPFLVGGRWLAVSIMPAVAGAGRPPKRQHHGQKHGGGGGKANVHYPRAHRENARSGGIRQLWARQAAVGAQS